MAWAVVNEYGRCLHSFISNKIGTSQVAEHEAIIAGLRIASKMRLDHFDICTDSSVPFGHFVKGWKCQRKFERYRTLYRLLSVGFKDVRLVLIKESENLAHEAAQPDGGILHEN
jgi:ribonuclease HI